MAEDSLDAVDPLDPGDAHTHAVFAQHERQEETQRNQAYLRARREAYVRLFSDRGMDGDAAFVLADLKRFCRGGRTPWDADQRVHALLTGRFEVYSRIEQHLTMQFDELWEMFNEGQT